jgi:tRNA(fMet)-specific endonuclease VapC
VTLRYLLDTSIVSSPVSKEPSIESVKQIEQHGLECAIGAPVWHDWKSGCQLLPRGKRPTALESYRTDVVQPSFTILPYDEAATAWHSRERARLEALGRPAPFADSQIAAIAHTNGLVLVTVNTKDFGRFRDLQVEDWSKPKPRQRGSLRVGLQVGLFDEVLSTVIGAEVEFLARILALTKSLPASALAEWERCAERRTLVSAAKSRSRISNEQFTKRFDGRGSPIDLKRLLC